LFLNSKLYVFYDCDINRRDDSIP